MVMWQMNQVPVKTALNLPADVFAKYPPTFAHSFMKYFSLFNFSSLLQYINSSCIFAGYKMKTTNRIRRKLELIKD